MSTKIQKISVIGGLTALAMIFSYVEFLVPSLIPVPGAKIGFSNIVILLAMFAIGCGEAFIIGILKVFLTALLFGNLLSFFMSLSGFLLSFFFMLYLKKWGKNSIPGISLGGGVFHNFGQLLAASVYIGNLSLAKWSFIFSIYGIITGLITGFICKMIYERIKKYDWLSSR
ncbi:MAG: Gx transporter family protein [Lachnospiraceae bacterium]|nr:Gx transporter family protein [Lachnospiraceae bacterium]